MQFTDGTDLDTYVKIEREINYISVTRSKIGKQKKCGWWNLNSKLNAYIEVRELFFEFPNNLDPGIFGSHRIADYSNSWITQGYQFTIFWNPQIPKHSKIPISVRISFDQAKTPQSKFKKSGLKMKINEKSLELSNTNERDIKRSCTHWLPLRMGGWLEFLPLSDVEGMSWRRSWTVSVRISCSRLDPPSSGRSLCDALRRE